MYENRIFKRDAFNAVTCRRFLVERSETRATAGIAHNHFNEDQLKVANELKINLSSKASTIESAIKNAENV